MDPNPRPASLTLSPQSPPLPNPSSSSSSIFRPRRSEDWQNYRETIEQLYRNDQLKLRDVKRIMERDYNFYASEKQYKDRFAEWNLRKNLKQKEVHVMLRKQKRRAAQGKQTAFRLHGQVVDKKRITRFGRRYPDVWNHVQKTPADKLSPEPETPSDMTYFTPEPAEESSAPISPMTEMHSPTPREMGSYPYLPTQSRLDSLPNLVVGDDQGLPPLSMHPSRRSYPSVLHTSQPPVAIPRTPTATATLGSDEDAEGEPETHPEEWNRLESFQTRLEGLQQTLDLTMSKWARENDPNHEFGHNGQNGHEGLGM
ncbi:uncharacterized protein PFLUO_LOCUS2054 [Penicillium psychrofluorescens]|uniref:uncharacterized protein n=1 Tax=Penicillium psychrofluorescens TaxID=3158075 RepID=UPI003CCDD383